MTDIKNLSTRIRILAARGQDDPSDLLPLALDALALATQQSLDVNNSGKTPSQKSGLVAKELIDLADRLIAELLPEIDCDRAMSPPINKSNSQDQQALPDFDDDVQIMKSWVQGFREGMPGCMQDRLGALRSLNLMARGFCVKYAAVTERQIQAEALDAISPPTRLNS